MSTNAPGSDTQDPSNGSVLRPLTAIEEVSWTFNAIDTFNAVVVAHVSGETTARAWQSALDVVQQRHALLSVSIALPHGAAVGEAQPVFHRRRGPRIPLRVLAWTEVPRWETEVEHELGHPFEPEDCPLLRATVVLGSGRALLILAAAHVVTDGISLSLIVRDLLTAMAGGHVAELPVPATIEALLGLSAVLHPPVPAERRRGVHVDRRTGTPTVSSLQMPEHAMRGILAACHRHECSLHGALVAASVEAMRRCAPAFASKPVRTLSPIDVRDVLGAGDANGMYIVLHGITFGPSDGTPFWESARKVRSELAIAAGRESVEVAAEAMQHLVANGLTRKEAAHVLEGPLALDVLVTNLGRTPYASKFAGLTLDWLAPAVMNTRSQSQAVAAATVDGVLTLTNTSREPIPRLLETVHAILRTQCMDA